MDAAIRSYLDALRDYVKVAQDLGLMKAPIPAPLIDARTLNVTPEAARALAEVVAEMKKLGPMPEYNDD